MAQTRTESDHLEMLRHPERWQHLMLPLRHASRRDGDGWALLGFVFLDGATGEAAPKVYVGCIFFYAQGQRLADLPVEEFADLEALVNDGWRVD